MSPKKTATLFFMFFNFVLTVCRFKEYDYSNSYRQLKTILAETAKYTVFETGSYVLLEPATGKPKDRLHSRKFGPFLVLWYTDDTYDLQNLVSKKKFRVNIKRTHPDEKRVNPQEVASRDSDEFIVESILGHTFDFKKKNY